MASGQEVSQSMIVVHSKNSNWRNFGFCYHRYLKAWHTTLVSTVSMLNMWEGSLVLLRKMAPLNVVWLLYTA